jgi:hypothetical protein
MDPVSLLTFGTKALDVFGNVAGIGAAASGVSAIPMPPLPPVTVGGLNIVPRDRSAVGSQVLIGVAILMAGAVALVFVKGR